jgi:hypothetical protein
MFALQTIGISKRENLTTRLADFNCYRFYYLICKVVLWRLVKSISTDEVVWEAVLNNEVVQELRELILAGWCLSFHFLNVWILC